MCDAFIPPGCGSSGGCCDRGPTEARMSCAKRTHELKGGVYTKCECILRNGLQDSCMRVECQQRPAARKACLKKAGLDSGRYEDSNNCGTTTTYEVIQPQQSQCKPKMQMQMQMPSQNGLGDIMRQCGQVPMNQMPMSMPMSMPMPMSMQMSMPMQMGNFGGNGGMPGGGNCGLPMQSFPLSQLAQLQMNGCPTDQPPNDPCGGQNFGQALMGGSGANCLPTGFGAGSDMPMFYPPQSPCGGQDLNGGGNMMGGNMIGGGGYQAGPPTFSPASQQQMQYNPASFQAMPQTMMGAPPPSGIGAFGDGQTQQYPCF